jgi:hypothetical protein
VPVIDSSGTRAITRKRDFFEILNFRALQRATAKYVLKADVTECYQSIYTHSIPWALHTRAVAKVRRRDFSLFGNVLDAAVQVCQDGQTVGIPIGPDTSLVVAEIVLSAVDAEMEKRRRGIRGYRYVDDFELCCSTYSEAEEMLSLLESVLLEYELRLNPRKTLIIDLPENLEPKWSTELRAIFIRASASGQYYDLIRFFDRAFEFAKAYPEATVLKYAIERLRSVKLQPSNWPLLQSLFLQVITSEPSVISDVLSAFIAFETQSFQIRKSGLRECLNDIIQRHAPLGHDNEVAWAVWGALKFRIKLNRRTAAALSQMRNSFVVILALDAFNQGLLSMVDTSKWQLSMHQSELYDQQWLLSYEANYHKWMPSNGPRDHVNMDPHFSLLKRRRVHFYEPVTSASALPVRRTPPAAAALVPTTAAITTGY